MNERRRSSRRTLPTQRSAVIEIDGRTHLALIGDLAPDGAFLNTRLQIDPGTVFGLRIVVPGSGRPVMIPSEVVWSSDRFDPDSARPAGIAVRFKELDAEVKRHLEEFCSGFAASLKPTRRGGTRVEYRVIDRAQIEQAELDTLGAEGWWLAVAVPSGAGLRLVFQRRA